MPACASSVSDILIQPTSATAIPAVVIYSDATGLGSAGQLQGATAGVEEGCQCRGDAPGVGIGPARILKNPRPGEQVSHENVQPRHDGDPARRAAAHSTPVTI